MLVGGNDVDHACINLLTGSEQTRPGRRGLRAPLSGGVRRLAAVRPVGPPSATKGGAKRQGRGERPDMGVPPRDRGQTIARTGKHDVNLGSAMAPTPAYI